MTVTSTYDHRIIQGAESGLFLARHRRPAQGRGRLLRAHLRGPGPAAPPRALGDGHGSRPRRSRGQPRGGREAGAGAAAHPQLPRARPSRGRPRPARQPSARPTATSIPRPTGSPCGTSTASSSRTASPARTRPRCARSSRSCATPTATPSASSTCTSPIPSGRTGCRTGWSRRGTTRPSTRRARSATLEKLVEAESFERFLHAKYVGHKRFSLEGGEALIPAARPHPERRRPRGRRGSRHRHVAPRPAERPGQHGGQAAGPDLLGVRGPDATPTRPRARAT